MAHATPHWNSVIRGLWFINCHNGWWENSTFDSSQNYLKLSSSIHHPQMKYKFIKSAKRNDNGSINVNYLILYIRVKLVRSLLFGMFMYYEYRKLRKIYMIECPFVILRKVCKPCGCLVQYCVCIMIGWWPKTIYRLWKYRTIANVTRYTI